MARIGNSNLLIRDKTYYYFSLVVILSLALGIRLIGLNKGIWLDEFASINLIQKGGLYETLRAVRFDTHPPLYFLLLELWSHVRSSEEFLRLLSVIFGIGTIVVIMKWMKQYSNLASVLAGLLFATIPIMLRYSQEIRGYSLLVFATALSFLFASRLLAQPERLSGYLGLAFSLSIAVSTHLVGIMLIIPLCAFIIVSSKIGKQKIYYGRAILVTIPPCLVFVVSYFFYLIYLDQRTENWWMPIVSWQTIISTAKSLFGFSAISTLLQDTKPETLTYFDYAIQALFLLAIIVLTFLGDWRRGIPFLVAFSIFWLEMILYSHFKKPIFIDRTVLPSLVPFIGFITLQIVTIREGRIKKAYIIGFILLCLIFTSNWITDQAWKPAEEWRGVSKPFMSKWRPGDLVVFYPFFVEGPIRYYFSDLPDEAVVKVDFIPDVKKLEAQINDRIAMQSGLGYQPTIFLIFRNDPNVQKKPELYHQLLSMLESKTKKPLVIYRIK